MPARLLVDQFAEVERAAKEEDRDDAHAHRDFVGDQLGAGADAADEWILGIGRVTGEHDPVNRERHDAKGVEHADVQVGDDHLLLAQGRAEGNDRDRQERRDHRHRRREPEVDLADMRRREVLLEERLKAIGDRLENAQPHEEWSDHRDRGNPGNGGAIRTHAILDERRDLALHEHRVGDHRQQPGDRARDLDQREDHEFVLGNGF